MYGPLDRLINEAYLGICFGLSLGHCEANVCTLVRKHCGTVAICLWNLPFAFAVRCHQRSSCAVFLQRMGVLPK